MSPGPRWHHLYRWIVSQASEFLSFETVYLITDNRDLLASTVNTIPGLSHWPMVAAWWKERIKYVGPYGEHTTVVFVPITTDTGLERVHPTWAGTYILDACVYLFPNTNFALIDSDCVPVTLYEVQELWRSCDDFAHAAVPLAPDQTPTSAIAPAHKRARSVDTGKATQQPGPPAKLPKSRSVENLLSTPLRAPFPGSADNLVEEVDYGGSEGQSPRSPVQVGSVSGTSWPTAQPSRTPGAARMTQNELKSHPTKGVILVSEAFTEINAGLVIILASGHASPITEADLADPTRDPDELAAFIVKSYHEHVEGYLATTRPPQNTEEAVSSGLLGSPLLGTRTRAAADWCHAWSLLGQWSGWVTFPVPEADVWPRHGHLRGILDGYQGRQPNFHKWARPAYEQGALPTLSLLPGDVTIRVLPGDKIYQAMEIEPEFMRPAILHGFGTSAKKRLPMRLGELAQYGWMPLAAALFGTVKWQPQWLHHNFLPVIGLRVHAKVPPPPLTDRQLVALLGLWERGAHRGLQCRALVQAAQLDFGLPTAFEALGTWHMDIKGYTFDIVHCAQQIYTGTAASDSQASLDRPRKWAQWVFSLEEVWQEDVPMQDRPLMVHCSGLGGGLLSPDHDWSFLPKSCSNEGLWAVPCNDWWLGAACHSTWID